ncbi:MAG: alpha/beta fold hydrolase [Burkholderiales bacterium]|nr:alpha/beta fold hydrolase [Burkholderiales bacterium]
MKYFYLHGFASGINSAKAIFFKEQFANINIELECLDLNGKDFSRFTLSKVINELKIKFKQYDKITLIGSSMGGLISLNLVEMLRNIKKIILLAPALEFNSHWDKLVGNDNLIKWKKDGSLPIYNTGLNKEFLLHYGFYLDMQNIKDRDFNTKNVKIISFHGIHDKTIPIESSRNFSINNKVLLNELDSDHALTDALPEIWPKVAEFIIED